MNKIFFFAVFIFCLSYQAQAQEAVIARFIEQGIKMHDKGNYKEAVEIYQKALARDRNNAQANYEIASSYFALKDYGNAIKYSDIVIKINTDNVDLAYILKGSALDQSGNPRAALATYNTAIKKSGDNHLLFYNLALTSYKLKAFKPSAEALQEALRLNPYHASSHLLLGQVMVKQQSPVKALLAYYHFLLMEPNSGRTAAAWKAMDAIFENSQSTKTIAANDEFYTAETILKLLVSAKSNEANKLKPVDVLFSETTHSLFTILGEQKNNQKGFWWDFYVNYFYTLAKENHTEVFCRYITQANDPNYAGWVQQNQAKFDAFSAWYKNYLHKY